MAVTRFISVGLDHHGASITAVSVDVPKMFDNRRRPRRVYKKIAQRLGARRSRDGDAMYEAEECGAVVDSWQGTSYGRFRDPDDNGEAVSFWDALCAIIPPWLTGDSKT